MARTSGRADDERAMRRFTLLLLAAALYGAVAQSALAAAPRLAFAGGTPAEQTAVRSALAASSFDWSVLPTTVIVHIGPIGSSYSEAGDVHLDSTLLRAGRFAWGVVQHEFAHQVDFLLLDDAKRARLNAFLGGKDWCYSVPGLAHADYGCERFASTLAWAYWQTPDNSMAPASTRGESASVPVAAFRALLADLLGMPSIAAPPAQAKAFAPATAPAKPKAPARPKPRR
jgi:hypothetical protein